jgi:hypothetical protein
MHRAGTEVATHVDPTVQLEVVAGHPAPQISIGDRVHQGAVNRARPRHAKWCGAAIGPFRERHGRRGLGRLREIVTPLGRCIRIGWRGGQVPLKLVVVDETRKDANPQVAIETRIILVGIALGRWHVGSAARLRGAGKRAKPDTADQSDNACERCVTFCAVRRMAVRKIT